MRKITFLKSLLLLCALMAGVGSAWGADKWVKTAPEDLVSGDIVVIVDLTSSKAMSNDNGTSSAPSATAVTLNVGKDQLTGTVADNVQWEVTVNAGSFMFGVSDKYLYVTKTNNGVRVGSGERKAFTIKIGGDKNGYYLYNKGTDNDERYIGCYTESDWRCYGSINSNIKVNNNAFFKKTVSTKTDVTLSFEQNSYDADLAEGANSFTAPTLTKSAEVTVVYSSSDNNVATVNSSTGVVTLVKKGTTVITATFGGDETYESATASYTLNVDDSNAKGTQKNPFTVAEAIPFIKNNEYEADVEYYVKGIISSIKSSSVSSGKLNYNISDDGTTTTELYVYGGKNLNGESFVSVSDIAVGDQVVIVGKLSYYQETTPEFASDNYIFSTTHKILTDPELVVVGDFSMEVTETKSVVDLYLTDSDGDVTVTSSKEDVVKIEDGLLKAVGKGTATITVNVAASETYNAVSKNFKVTVTVKPAVQPEGATAGGFTLVSDASTLADGDKLILVNGDGDCAAGTASDKNNRPGVKVTLKDGTINVDETVQVITLEGEADARYFNVGDDAYLYASSNSSNQLKTAKKTTAGDNGKAKISIAEGVATITFQGTNGRNLVRFNPNNGSPIFSCYASNATTGSLPKLYRQGAASSFDIKVGKTGWRTLVSAQDVTLPEGLTAYVVTANDGGSATLATAGSVKANTPYILEGAEGTYTLTVALGVTAPASNLLQISTESTGNGVYVLYNGTQGVGFYKWYGGSLGAGRVYLPATAGAPEFIALGGETTGIDMVQGSSIKVQDPEIYNLAGQRVARPTKGLYIVNGKKVVIR